jgi:hypothetical protein
MDDIEARLKRHLSITRNWKFHNLKEEKYGRAKYMANYMSDLVELPDGATIYGWSYKKGLMEAAKVLLPGARVLQSAFLDADGKWWAGIHPDHIADDVEKILRTPNGEKWRYSHHQMLEALENVGTRVIQFRSDKGGLHVRFVMKDALGNTIDKLTDLIDLPY